MMLITASEVISMAFTSVEQVKPEIINSTKIIAAEQQYLRPVFGKLYDAMVDGQYDDFVAEYIRPALAYYVRYGVIPDLSISLGNTGAMTFGTQHSSSASDKQRQMLRSQAIADADALICRAIRHIEANKEMFPEYEVKENIKKKTSIKGGFIFSR